MSEHDQKAAAASGTNTGTAGQPGPLLAPEIRDPGLEDGPGSAGDARSAGDPDSQRTQTHSPVPAQPDRVLGRTQPDRVLGRSWTNDHKLDQAWDWARAGQDVAPAVDQMDGRDLDKAWDWAREPAKPTDANWGTDSWDPAADGYRNGTLRPPVVEDDTPHWTAPPVGFSGHAIASFVFGFFGIPLLGVLFGIGALVTIRRTGQEGRWMAITGICLSGAWILLLIVLFRVVLPLLAGR
ncbi:DUF4190 domain-containing protein [Longispora sp. NPDC051575]|uniref:DUF4190 domain-containing protein n=1 Tax=Longispora sp. NPDC051575 TaxID=3154943 RepID=UPI00341C987C